MRRSRPSPEHAEAVSRRLASLSVELAAVRGDPPTPAHPGGRPDGSPAVPPAGPPSGPPSGPASAHASGPAGIDPERSGQVHAADPRPVRAREHAHTRVRDLDPTASPSGTDEPVHTVVPLPGRHATRRRTGAGLDAPSGRWRPGELWAGRPRLTVHHLAALAVAVAVAMGVLAWAVLAARPDVATVAPRVEPPATDPAETTAAGPGASQGSDVPDAAAESAAGSAVESSEESAAEGAAEGGVVVDVAGKVRRPGIAVLPAGSRVVDAIEAAGGARAGVDLVELNLARVLVDGEQLLVGIEPPTGVLGSLGTPATPGTPGATTQSGALVDLNAADATLLDTLPGVGPVTAAAIIDWRTQNGGFTSVEELLDVDGIGEATLADLAPLVTV